MVNIVDIDQNEIPAEIPAEIWTDIYQHQTKLMLKYHEIEAYNGVGYRHVCDIDYDIDSPLWQEYIKSLIFRILEEIAEAMAAHSGDHYREELIDALHFAVELMIVVSRPIPKCNLESTKPLPRYYMQSLILKHYGLAANQLKNKPWKQTFQPTDTQRFYQYLDYGFNALYTLLIEELYDLEQIYIYYMKKNKVNQFRQKSNY